MSEPDVPTEAVRPTPEDGRYELRLKRRVAQAYCALADGGVVDHALAALAEIAMGKTLKGEPLENLERRTQVQAAAAFFRHAASLYPKSLEVSGPEGGPIHLSAADLVKEVDGA